MKLKEVKLQNFRGYKNETTIPFENLTVLIGRNDAGKSSVLDALNIFFNDAEIEKEDACVNGSTTDVRICCVFSELPKEIVLDDQHQRHCKRNIWFDRTACSKSAGSSIATLQKESRQNFSRVPTIRAPRAVRT